MDTQQKAWIAFAEADTLATIQQAVTLYPLLRQPDFITAIEQVIAEQAPPEQRPAFLQRLTWLHQLAKEQNP